MRTETVHITKVVEKSAVWSPVFQAECDQCGKIGQPQDREGDAADIAGRHFEQHETALGHYQGLLKEATWAEMTPDWWTTARRSEEVQP